MNMFLICAAFFRNEEYHVALKKSSLYLKSINAYELPILIDTNGFEEHVLEITKYYCNNDIRFCPDQLYMS